MTRTISNDLNQYDERTVPNTFDVVGIAPATSSVLVNGSAADQRKVEYFREQVAVTNTSGSVTNGNLCNVFVPKTAEVFAYDADGNPKCCYGYTDLSGGVSRDPDRSPPVKLN